MQTDQPELAAAAAPAPQAALRGGVVTLLGAATLGVVMLSPAITLYGNFAASFASAGKAAPLAFIVALLATLPTAASYALLSRDRPVAGSAATWVAQLSHRAARAASWMVFLYYLTNFVLQPVTFGLFFSDLCAEAGLPAGFGAYTAGAVLCCAIPAGIVYRGIAPSTKGALAFLVTEAVVVAALCATSAWRHPAGPLDVSGFHLAAAATAQDPSGLSGLARALVFAMLSFCGFDVVSTLAEEAKMPRTLIPQATFAALLSFGAIIVGGIWCLTFSASPERLRALNELPGMPITAIARDFWGHGAMLVMITGISAALGIVIATSVGASRVLFAMARDGMAPRIFAGLHPAYRVPWSGLHLVFGAGLLGALVAAFALSPWSAYLWWGTTSTFFAMVTFLLVNLCNLLLNRDRILRTASGFFLYGVLPVTGLAVDLVILVRCFFIEAWGQGALGRSAIAFDALCALLALTALFGRRSST